MRVAIPVWFEVVSLEDAVSSHEMEPKVIESAAEEAVGRLVFLDRDGPENDACFQLKGFGKVWVTLLGTDPD